MIVFHKEKSTLRTIVKQHYNYALGDCRVFAKHFKNWLVLDIRLMSRLGKQQFYYIKNSPLTAYLRLDRLKMLILIGVLSPFIPNLWLIFLFLLLANFFIESVHKKSISKAFYDFTATFFCLIGHIMGSLKYRVFHI
jgi:hypothetical protein